MGRKRKSTTAKSNLMKIKRSKVLSAASVENKNDFNRLNELQKNVSTSVSEINHVQCNDVSSSSCNIIVNFDVLQQLFTKTCCVSCKNSCINLRLGKKYGLSHEIIIYCDKCDFRFNTTSSKRLSSDSKSPYTVNRTAVQAITALGKGHAGMELFSSFMNLSVMDSKTFSRHLKHVVLATKVTVINSLNEIRQKVKIAHVNQNSALHGADFIDIAVSFDGSWHKRGHNSNYGVGCVIDTLTGYVIDYATLSKTCKECSVTEKYLSKNSAEFSVWYEGHKSVCDADFNGSSGAMEVEIAKRLWRRSINYGLRYTVLLGDGDSRTFKSLQESQVYGPDIVLKKEECINHVGKRMGSALRKLVESEKKRGITLGGRKYGSLKESTISKLTKYYRNAIQRNIGDVVAMKTDIYAILYHCSSTDEKPFHKKCPYKADSWCFYNRALCEGKKPESHKTKIKTPLTMDVVCKIMPIFQRLADDSLLERCSQGKTQNSNESLHSLIWSRCSKQLNTSKQRVEAAVSQAVLDFNVGASAYAQNLQKNTGVSPSAITFTQLHRKDKRRCRKSTQKSSAAYKLYRKKVHLAKLKLCKEQNSKKEKLYKSGSF